MLEKQREITRNAFFSDKRLGEHILYNDIDIIAITEIGTALSRGDWNEAATQVEHASILDNAIFTVRADDLPDKKPIEGDTIIYNGDKYSVTQHILFDSAANAYVVSCMRNGKAYGGKRVTTR